MYESFFALKENPFSLTPNPRFLFLSKTHNEVYAHLLYGIENRAGFVEVTGEVGTGKTTILRTLLGQLDDNKYRVAFIFNPKLTAFELLRNINREFGVDDDGLSSPDLIHALNSFLLEENKLGRTPILVIDEAQNLSGEVLEQIRLLSNLETDNDKLIQVVLVGQPELRRHLSDHSLRQLNQRIAVRYQLRPLNPEETKAYVCHRLKIAGRPDGQIFSVSALKKVFDCTSGVPRRINLVCDRALLTAYSEERGIVSARDVRQANAELAGMGEVGVAGRGVLWRVFAATAASLLIVVLASYLLGFLDNAVEISAKPKAATVAQPTSERNIQREKGSREGRTSNLSVPGDSLIAGINAVFSSWESSLLKEGLSAVSLDLEREAKARGFSLAHLAGSFSVLRQYNVPLLMPLPESQGGGYLAILEQLADNIWRVEPSYKGKKTLSSEELDGLGMSMAIVPWKDFASIGYVAVPGVRGENVRRLQFMLALTGCDDVPTSGRYDSLTSDCIKDFQRAQGLVVDGLVGPRTLMHLYRAAGAYNMPRLTDIRRK